MKKISELFKDIPHRSINIGPESVFSGLSSDSRTIKRDELFIAVKGFEQDGHNFVKEALKKGAAAVCSERAIKGAGKAGFIIVEDTAKVLPILASRFFGEPSKSLKLIGITGTNGKTTTTHLIYEILKAAKKSPSLLGTVQYRVGGMVMDPRNTTPGPLLLHSLLGQMKNCGTDYVVTEVSSHALRQSRVSGINFSLAALTNVTSDHLDYHRSISNYVESKRILFDSLDRKSFAILNSDDKYYNEFKGSTRARIVSYGIENDADFKATHIELDINGSHFFIDTPKGTINMRTPLIGQHNIYNILAAAAIAFAEGIEINTICEAIGHFSGIPGRLETVEAGQPFKVFIDYAHTHDALEKVLSTLRQISRGRIIVVFGCGGNRDRTKRPKMGKIASRLAGYVILTNDNPRKEAPDTILSEIEKGFDRDFRAYKKIPDRFKAIEESLTGRDASDIVIIAGKGHEDCQIIGSKAIPFNDKNAVERILTTMNSRAHLSVPY